MEIRSNLLTGSAFYETTVNRAELAVDDAYQPLRPAAALFPGLNITYHPESGQLVATAKSEIGPKPVWRQSMRWVAPPFAQAFGFANQGSTERGEE